MHGAFDCLLRALSESRVPCRQRQPHATPAVEDPLLRLLASALRQGLEDVRRAGNGAPIPFPPPYPVTGCPRSDRT